MRKILLLLLSGILFASCSDECTQSRTYVQLVPKSISYESLANSIASTTPRELKTPGKIYTFGKYLLIGEVKEGIHLIDNSNPSSPKPVSFIKIPGVLDFAIRDNVLYADHYTDLVALDISDPLNIKEAGRKKKMFNSGTWNGARWFFNPGNNTITDYDRVIVTETFKTNCGNDNPSFFGGGWLSNSDQFNAGPTGPSGETGQGGSMARFTISKDHLYAVTDNDLLVFDIRNPSAPDSSSKINLGWGIETIFPYEDKLFIGSNTGMFIYDNKNPAKPERMSVFNHARACDPVVVQGDRAYVTLRSGLCGAAPNQLHVINIANLYAPVMIKSYEMQNPHGLSVKGNTLSICEGAFGLKSFDISQETNIRQLQHLGDVHAFDVIQLAGNVLLMIGDDGFYQYDNSDPANLKLLSKIDVKK